ncbi:MAG: 4-hydroxy-tetrahydrodipicolinate reductase [Ginsengibacter sp.]
MNIALIGYGKMGKAIEGIALQKGHHIVLKIDVDNYYDFTSENLRKANVAIEFTTPDTAIANIRKCFEADIPIVVGTTGWLNELDDIKKECEDKKGTLITATNFSIGVNLFFAINDYVSKLMSPYDTYDISLEETHHTQKKDAPSGTAITLAEQLLKNIPSKNKWVNEASNDDKHLAIISKRVDPAPGTHSVKYSSSIDDIEIIHTAHNREGFALGAVLAAEFIAGKKGIYSMKDVLGI